MRLSSALLPLVCTSGLAAATPPADSPVFVAQLIAAFRAAPPTTPRASILRYAYRGQTVYFVPARCCDIPSTLYDAGGRRLCEPDGGFVGGGDGRCPDFFERRGGETLVWKDLR